MDYSIKLTFAFSKISVFILIFLYFLEGIMSECPHVCECKWKSGKESVLCLNANLSIIPERLDAGTQILDLTGNEIFSIEHDVFANANLLNLQKIFLSKCRIKNIERYAFRNLKNLVELDLSYNLLTIIPSHAFEFTPEIRELKLNGNPIQKFTNQAFLHTPHLVRLEMSDCKINLVEEKAFSGLESSLEWLKLDGNKLFEINPQTFTILRNLNGLELARNPWNCSCSLRPLRIWMLKENIPYGIPPVCKYPVRLFGKSWEKIDIDEFACAPLIFAPEAKAYGIEGNNITITCKVEGIPEPNVRWIVRNRIIANLSSQINLPSMQGRKLYMTSLIRNCSNLTIITIDIQDAGVYTCSAENKAGIAEASVTLAVSRKPQDASLGVKAMLFCVLIAVLFVIISSMSAICFCSLRKKHKIGRWSAPTRSDSYEKIEMSRKPEVHSFLGENNGYLRQHNMNEATVISSIKKNGNYRNIPTDEDVTNYEDRNNVSGCPEYNIQSYKNNIPRKEFNCTKDNGLIGANRGDTDLHIPRLVDISSNVNSGSSSISSQVDAFCRLNKNVELINQSKPTLNFSLTNKQPQELSVTDHPFTNADLSNIFSSFKTKDLETNLIDTHFPDLLDVSLMESICETSSNNLCTIPRKSKYQKKSFNRSSDSQSPLLSDCFSSYDNNTLVENISLDTINRRSSTDLYTNYLPKQLIGNTDGGKKSSSFISLISSGNNMQHRNPSLPSSPVKEAHNAFSPTATPLLDFKSLTKRNLIVPTSFTTINDYDYHAAQLERFLEEYRNLQEQLCRMKETCDSIRKKEEPNDTAISKTGKINESFVFNGCLNGKNVLKETSITRPERNIKKLLPGQPPEPPPYWLHKSTVLKRNHNQQSEFFQS